MNSDTLPEGNVFSEVTSTIASGCVIMCVPASTDLSEDPFCRKGSGAIVGLDADSIASEEGLTDRGA
ncbi:MAG: hypothetical protein K9M84_02375 [Spirochaetia bacterium]|nr:hypothetical protein [Spirochaetia bacterium]